MRDTIQIMGGVFEPAQLRELVESLEAAEHRCAVFEGVEGISAALTSARTKLLFVGADDGDLSSLAAALRVSRTGEADIPVLLYFKQCPLSAGEVSPIQEIDDFLLPPLKISDMLVRVKRLLQRSLDSQDELKQAKQSLLSHFGMKQFIGASAAFTNVVEKIPRVAACDAAVLIMGDTGSGKEMCARAVHYISPRSAKPFIPVNCGSIPTELFESEMFGHEPGAFTDARRAKRGLVAEAEGGTLFLDEIDSLPLSAQVKLLRFLQDRQYRPLGASGYRQANVRLIAASNQNLRRKVQEGTFREDLYYRLKVVTLSLPALRDRGDDILPLASHFLQIAAREYNRPVTRFSHEAVRKLLAHSWPGNVRELENVIHQAVVLSNGNTLRAHDLELSSDAPAVFAPPGQESLKAAKARVIENFERSYLNEVLSSCGGNISKAAREAKKDRRAFFALLKKYNLNTSQHPTGHVAYA